MRFLTVALDTNFLCDLARDKATVWKAFRLLKQAAPTGCAVSFIITPTVMEELETALTLNLSHGADAAKALSSLIAWGVMPHDMEGVMLGVAEQVANAILHAGLLPSAERNDAFVLAEAALAEAFILSSSDAAMRSVPADKLANVIHRKCGCDAPRILSPRAILNNPAGIFAGA